ncbi:hypothetical protein [Gynurincola endophyticus]|uniref:hypothetical protein n=1 Tax=Gynurincola endophyticus TaxID=2479004 RepID=UPI000F8E55C0|nr:hypothetical protein [Gynurincola endophyticus]
MRFSLPLILCLFFTINVVAQSSIAKPPEFGKSFVINKKSTDFKMLGHDESGMYFQVEHNALKNFFLIGYNDRSSGKLIKVDNQLNKVFNKDYSSALKGKGLIQLVTLNKKFYLLAAEVKNKNTEVIIQAAPINKSTGELDGAWVSLETLTKANKKDEVNFNIFYNPDSTSLIITSRIEGKSKSSYHVTKFDQNFHSTPKKVVLSNNFAPENYDVEDLIYTDHNRIILVGKVYENIDNVKKKQRPLTFSHLNTIIYDENGTQLKVIDTKIPGINLNTTRVFLKDKKVILTSFYSNKLTGNVTDGLLVKEIDILSGDIISNVETNINPSMLVSAVTNGTAKPGFSAYLKFISLHFSPDGNIIIVSEAYNQVKVVRRTYGNRPDGAFLPTSTNYQTICDSGEILICNIKPDKGIEWLKIIPKKQSETHNEGETRRTKTTAVGKTIETTSKPYYSGILSFSQDKYLQIIFNDYEVNGAITSVEQKPKLIKKFKKSAAYMVSIDMNNGNTSRKLLFSNSKKPILMPRHSIYTDNTLYMVGLKVINLNKTKGTLGKFYF